MESVPGFDDPPLVLGLEAENQRLTAEVVALRAEVERYERGLWALLESEPPAGRRFFRGLVGDHG
jgi:hypothetical protein